MLSPFDSVIHPGFTSSAAVQYYPADTFPWIHPIHWLHSHFAVGGWSPLTRLSGMITAHMTQIAPHNGFTWHPHRGLEIYTWVLEGELYHEDNTGGKGVIQAGELQRMFSGRWIEHQELNRTDDPVRVIQIWFAADPRYQHLEPHYQQLTRDDLPVRENGNGCIYSLIDADSPVESHVNARLTATFVEANGTTTIELPHEGEDLFLYVTDGAGAFAYDGESQGMDVYDVLLTRPGADPIQVQTDVGIRYMCFYLPQFLT